MTRVLRRFFCRTVAAATALAIVLGLALAPSATEAAGTTGTAVHRCRSIENGLWSPVTAHRVSCGVARPVLVQFVVGRRGRWRQTAPDGQAGAIQGQWKSPHWYCWASIPFVKLGAERATGGVAACFSRRHPIKVFISARPNA